MVDLKYELSTIGVTKKFNKLTSKKFKEIEINNDYFYEILDKDIKTIQKKLAKRLSHKIETNLSSVAYKKNHSYFDFLLPHKDNYNFLRLDIKSFFHSIKEKYIRQVFNNYFKNIDNNSYLKFDDDTIAMDSFINLTTVKVHSRCRNKKYRGNTILPIGFITSPIISNIILRPIDIQIQKLCRTNNIIYSRYADDMLFSTDKNNIHIAQDIFTKNIQKILLQYDLKLNRNKTLRAKHTLSLNGYTINDSEIRLSNKKTAVINKMIHFYNSKMEAKEILRRLFKYQLPSRCNVLKSLEKKRLYDDQLLNKLSGYRSFLISIIKFNNKNNSFNNTLTTESKYQKIIAKIEEIMEDISQSISI